MFDFFWYSIFDIIERMHDQMSSRTTLDMCTIYRITCLYILSMVIWWLMLADPAVNVVCFGG